MKSEDDDESGLDFQGIFETEREKNSTYTAEEIRELREMGMSKPDEVSWGDWNGPADHSHRHDLLVQYAAMGCNNNEIAQELGYTASTVSRILSQKSIKEKIRKVQQESWGENAKDKFEQLMYKSIKVNEEILDDAQAGQKLRSEVGWKFIERAIGKPQQSVSVEGNLLGDLLSKLDESKREAQREVKELADPPDSIESFIQESIPDGVTVGKRGQDEEDEG